MRPAPQTVAIVLAGGSSTRLGTSANKVYLEVGGRPVLAWSLATLDAHPAIDRLVVVVRDGDQGHLDTVLTELSPRTPLSVAVGGATRVASEHAALDVLRADIEAGTVGWILVHDGARPFASGDLIDRVVAATQAHGGALPAVRFDQPVFRRSGPRTAIAVDPVALRRVQTPQGFSAKPLLAAYDQAMIDQIDGADTAEVVTRFTGLAPVAVDGDPDNIKVTLPTDLDAAAAIASRWARSGPGRA